MAYDKSFHGIVGYAASDAGQAFAEAAKDRKVRGEAHLNANGFITQGPKADAPGFGS